MTKFPRRTKPKVELLPVAGRELQQSRELPTEEILRLLDKESARWQSEMEQALEQGNTPAAQCALGGKRACQELKGELGILARAVRLAQRETEDIEAEDLLFEPWFRSRDVADAIRRHQTGTDRKRWTLYYDQHSCLSCKKQKLAHGGKGFCSACRGVVQKRIKAISQELEEERNNR